MKNEISHRCQQLLDHNKINSHEVVSIRKRIKAETESFVEIIGYDKWSMYRLVEDWDSNTTHVRRVCRISVCPFCGEVMDNEGSNND